MIKIVIIEDQPIILEGIKVLINLVEDFEVVAEFNNGKKFIDKMNSFPVPDIVLTDIDMPEMNGIDATKIALSIYPELRIIALSMYNDSRYYYEMITAGAKGFVLKQASVDELEKAIREVNNGGNYFSKDLLHSVILEMQDIEKEIITKRKDLLKLNERDIKMLTHICQGMSNKELADKLCLSIKTIESNKAKLMRNTHTKNTAGLIIWAIKNKVVEV